MHSQLDREPRRSPSDPRAFWRERVWLVYGFVATAALFGYFRLPPAARSHLWLLAFSLGAALAIFAGLRLHRPERHVARPWLLLGFGQLCLFLGDVAGTTYAPALGITAASPSPADLFYLLSYCLSLLGLALLGHWRSRRPADGSLLDAAVISIGLLGAAWILVLAPFVGMAQGGLYSQLVRLSYPLGGTLAVVLIIRLLLRGGFGSPAFVALVLAVGVRLASDLVLAWLIYHGAYYPGHPVSAGWMASYVLLGVAALHPSLGRVAKDEPEAVARTPRWRLLLLAVVAPIGPIAVHVELGRGHTHSVSLLLANMLVLYLLVLVRVAGMTRQIEALTEQRGEARLEALVQHTADLLLLLGPDGSARYVGPSLERVLGYTAAEARSSPLQFLVSLIIHPDDLGRAQRMAADLAARPGPTRVFELRLRHRDGSWRLIEMMGTNVLHNGNVAGIVLNGRDITERRRAEEALRLSETRYRAVVEATFEGIITADQQGVIRSFNRGAAAIFGCEQGALIGQPLANLLPALAPGESRACEVGTHEVRGLRCDGGAVSLEVSLTRVAGEQGEELMVVLRDITERKALEARLTQQAYSDPLTRLPNRAAFNAALAEALSRRGRAAEHIAVLFLDLDSFKQVNDSLGHEAGDELLVAVGRRLTGSIRPGDLAARLGGDEFAVLLDPVGDAMAAAVVARRICTSLAAPFSIKATTVTISASVGVALSEHANTLGDLMRHADAAMYRAKGVGKAGYAIYRPEVSK